MYWVIGLFDTKTEQAVKDIWNKLSENSIISEEEKVEDPRPHITLANYYDLNQDEYIGLMDNYYEDQSIVNISLNTIGSFLNHPTIFLSPTITKELMELHTNHHDYFKKFNRYANPYYLPDQWIPHCTLANKVSTDKLAEAFHYCLNNHQTIVGELREVALIQLADEGIAGVHAPIIFSKKLGLSGQR